MNGAPCPPHFCVGRFAHNRCGSGLQRVLLGFGKCSHEFRGEFGSLGVHGLLPSCQETNKVQRLLLQGGRQGLGLMKNLFRCTHNEKLPSRVYPVTI